ncbi:ABC transporter permease [Haloplanus sp. GCM10025708]|uniref:ABC transporter permease n=1 Tax=Haloferacaceae TaxID=1644056 RepID=UPI00360B4888
MTVAGTARAHAARILRIARWETFRTASVVDRRTAIVGLVALLLAGGVAGATATTGGVAIDRGIYRVGVAADSPYHAPVADSTALAAHPPDRTAFERGRLDVLVRDGEIHARDTRKGQAALGAFRDAVQRHNARLMSQEENRSAAFPVTVTLLYTTQNRAIVDGGTDGGGGGSGGSSGGASGAGGDASGTTPAGDGSMAVPDVGGTGLFATRTTGSPADISPPFPFASLVLAFAFFVPMNFVIQPYGSTILNERINRRGELLLVTPASPSDIVAGKTLPYFGLLVAVTALIAAAIGGGVVSVGAVVPLAALFLAATFVGAMFARSFKELTFVTVTVSVFLTTYAFVPAIFSNVTPIALISPLTLVVRDLQGTGVTAAQYAFSTGPIYLSAAVLFLLGVGVYREEDMFTQRPVPLKFLDALDSRISGPWSMALLSALSIPFVFVAELLAIALFFVLPVSVSVPPLLFVVAAVEEVAKSLPVYAGFEKERFPRLPRTALVLGGLSGLGFFLGEKLTAVVQLVGLPELALGRAAFAPAGVGPTAAVALLLAPLALHAGTTSISALGASRGRNWYAGALVVATGVHAAYNFAVVTALG